EKSGTWYAYAGTKLGQGRDKAMTHLEENPVLQQQLREALVRQSRAIAAGTVPAVTNGHTPAAPQAGTQ
ncbi:MAG TPA: DNA recombination/repair protein RecA, partial [Kofleriaceae bacterium]